MKTRPRVTSDTQQSTLVWTVVEKQCGACLGRFYQLELVGTCLPAYKQVGRALVVEALLSYQHLAWQPSSLCWWVDNASALQGNQRWIPALGLGVTSGWLTTCGSSIGLVPWDANVW